MPPPLAAAASGASSLMTTLRFNPVPDEDMLPEVRKEIADEMWEMGTPAISAIFNAMPKALDVESSNKNYKSARLNIYDSGATCGNFVDLTYAVKGSVRVNYVQMSTANGLYTPPKTFDAVMPVPAYLNGKLEKREFRMNGSFLNEQCPHNLIPPGQLAREQRIATWIAPGDEQSYALHPDGARTPLVNVGVMIAPDLDTPCQPVVAAEDAATSETAGVVNHADLDSLCPSITVGDRGFTKHVTGKRIHRRLNHRSVKTLRHIPLCTCRLSAR